MDLRHHLVEPNNVQDTYTQFNQVEFTLSYQGRKIEANTIRLAGEITLDNVSEFSDFKVDNFVGAHTFISEVLTSTSNQGLIETISNYGRYEGMLSKSVNRADDLNRSDQLCEIKSYSPAVVGDLMKGIQLRDNQTDVVEETDDASFSLRPNMAFNNVVLVNDGDQYLSHNKTGDINLSFRLARSEDFSYGSGNSATTGYSLKNLRILFNTVPDDGQMNQVNLRTKTSLEQVVNSNFTSLNLQVPAVCTGVSGSLMASSRLGNPKLSNYQQARLPNLQSLEFLFNNSQSEYITYQITSNVDATQRYLESFAEVTSNAASLENINQNEAYGIGLDFQGLVNLSNQKFGILLNAEVPEPHNLYLFFHGVYQL